jgi:hypothetical protein
MGRKRLDVAVATGMQTRALNGKLAVEFVDVIQWAHRAWLIFT